jgi:hypothetical protein
MVIHKETQIYLINCKYFYLFQETAIGTVPTKESMNLDGLTSINWLVVFLHFPSIPSFYLLFHFLRDELMSLPADYWHEDAKEVRKFLEQQVND